MIPALCARRQFILVRLVPLENGKTNKLPCSPTGEVVDAHDPQHWMGHDEAQALASAWGPGHGVGFVLTAADPFWCLDIDGCAEPGGWSPLAQELCRSLPGTVVEVSQSGRGLHIWGQGPVPPHAKKNTALHIELYTELRFILLGSNPVGDMSRPCSQIADVVARYFPPREAAAPGAIPDEGPVADWRGPTDDDDLIRRALASVSTKAVFGGSARFRDLWDADGDALARAFPGDPWDASSADMSLASHLAFWTGRDKARIERLMRRSELARPKWEERDDYLPRTIEAACLLNRDVCQDRAPEPAPAAGAEPVMVQGAVFLDAAAQLELFKGCVYVVGLDRVMTPDGALLKQSQFRARFGGYSFVMDAENRRTVRNAFEAFTESQCVRFPRADGTCFKPMLPFGALVERGDRMLVNTYRAPNVGATPGDVTPFLKHLEKLLPDQADRNYVLFYMAACVQFAGVKFQWCPVIQGVEGNGKSFLSRCVARAVGVEYTHWPKASKIAANFNGWMVGKVFFAVEDIYTRENSHVLEELKPMITGGDGLEIERKGVDQTSEEICGNFMLNTNHKDGIRKTRNDRRLAVFYCAQQEVEHLARDGMGGRYMPDLYAWANGEGYGRVAHYLRTLAIPDEMNPARGLQRAPMTTATREAIAQSLGPAEQEIMEAIEQGEPGFRGPWASSFSVDRVLERTRRSGAIPRNRRRDLMRSLGYDYHPGLIDGRVNNDVMPDGGKPRLYVKIGSPEAALVGAAEVAKAYSTAQGVAVR